MKMTHDTAIFTFVALGNRPKESLSSTGWHRRLCKTSRRWRLAQPSGSTRCYAAKAEVSSPSSVMTSRTRWSWTSPD